MHYMVEREREKKKEKEGGKRDLPAWPRGETSPGYALSFGLPGRGEPRRDFSGLHAGDC